MNVFESARHDDPLAAGVDMDLSDRLASSEPVLDRIDPILVTPIEATGGVVRQIP